MTDHDQISRRTAVTAVAATAALLPFAGAATAHAQEAPDQGRFFQHGVASGDPLPDGVLLWTRVTPTPRPPPAPAAGRPPR